MITPGRLVVGVIISHEVLRVLGQGVMKEKRALLLERQNSDSAVNRRIQDAVNILNSGSPEITEWDESVIRQLVDTVTVLSANKIRVSFRGGMESEQTLSEVR